MVAILKYGKAYDGSAYFDSQISASLIVYDPSWFGNISNDLTGLSLNWVDPSAEGSRDESNVEVFYRFPLFGGFDTTLSYMAIINPALDHENDFASAFSIRFVTSF